MGIFSFLKEHTRSELEGLRIAILATDGVEERELTEPRKAFENAGAKTELISTHEGKIRAWNKGKWGNSYTVDVPLDRADMRDYCGLVLPGGVMSPDTLRMNRDAVKFVKEFFEEGKPIAAICHGPWLMVEAGIVQGKKLTSWPSIKTDIQNAGGTWIDEEVVVDGTLITSRKPDDIPAFSGTAIKEFEQCEGKGELF